MSTAEVENGGDGVGLDLAEDEVKVCRQNCVFCFVQQMPKGFRKSLYLKDEDIRLSFLYGHFSTLSSSDDAELDRVIRERLSPIHVSVHATDPEVRVQVVGNRKEGHILRKIDHLLEGGVDMHAQVVVAPGLNDGWVWEKTPARALGAARLPDGRPLWAARGGVLSLSCVPVGLTAHREGLPRRARRGPRVCARLGGALEAGGAELQPRPTRASPGSSWRTSGSLARGWRSPAGASTAAPGPSWRNGVGLIRRFLEHSRRFMGRPRATGYRGRKALLLTGASFAPVLNETLARAEPPHRQASCGPRRCGTSPSARP